MSFAPQNETFAKPEVLLRVPVGLASPLWGLFAGVAMSGATWWWMTRWARPQNLEAMFGGEVAAEALVTTDVTEFAAQLVEAAEAVCEAMPEPMAEAAIEPAPELVEALGEATLEPVVEPLVEVAPVAVETASEAVAEPAVEAVVEAAPAPRVEALAESMPQPASEAPAETSVAPEPVGGEAPPVSAVLETVALEMAASPAVVRKPKRKTAPAPDASA